MKPSSSIRVVRRLVMFGLVSFSTLGATSVLSAESEVHEVQRGETLWTIAANAIGDARLWPVLYRANRDQIKNPALLYPGQKLSIPFIDSEMRATLRRDAGASMHK